MVRHPTWVVALAVGGGALLPHHVLRAESPFATTVESYVAGLGAASGYTNPLVALGSPERFTGDGLLPQAVTPFQPPFLSTEIVSLGMGGSLVLSFDHDVLDDPANPFGVDLLVFSNAFATDIASPAGVVGGFFGEGGSVWVSSDGVQWTLVPGVDADSPLPTLGYLDVGPYATTPGRVPSDFTRPVNPAFGTKAFLGGTYEQILALYDGSGGGAGIDLAALGLERIRYVRIDGGLTFGFSPEIDAVADVAPQASTLGDLNADGAVNAADLALLLGAWGTAGPGDPGDLDQSGTVDAADLSLLLGAWS